MNIRKITVLATISLATMATSVTAQKVIDLPLAVPTEREARNAAYKQRLRKSQASRRQMAQAAASAAAEQRANARRDRLALRVTTSAPTVISPLSPSYNRLLNGEQIESLESSRQRRYDSYGYTGYGYPRVGKYERFYGWPVFR